MRSGPRVAATPPAPGQATPAPASPARPQCHRPSCPGRGRPGSLQHRRELRFPEGPHGICRKTKRSNIRGTGDGHLGLQAPRPKGCWLATPLGRPSAPLRPHRPFRGRRHAPFTRVPPGRRRCSAPRPGRKLRGAHRRSEPRAVSLAARPPRSRAGKPLLGPSQDARPRPQHPAGPDQGRPGPRRLPSAPAAPRPRGRVSEGPKPPVCLGSEE